MKRTVAIVLLAVVLCAVGWCAFQFDGARNLFRSADRAADADSDDQKEVVALGWVEPAGGLIEIRGPAGDRLESLEVEEGSSVQKGQPLACLESRSLRHLELQSIESQLAEAEARHAAESKLADARITTAELAIEEAKMLDLDVQAQQKTIDVLRANLQLAQNDLRRLEGLSEDLVSDQERERQALVVQQAEAELSAAQTMLQKTSKSLNLSVEAARAELLATETSKDQVLTSIPVGSLEKRRDLARKQWEQTVIEAPCRGTILKIFVRPGESIGMGPLLQMADLERMVAVAEVYETDVKRVHPGQTALITSRAFKPPYDRRGITGKVCQIGRSFATPGLENPDPLARVDRHVVEVRVELDEEGSKATADFSNLQVDVTFLPGRDRDRPAPVLIDR